ncbi:MAG: hypothetical protein SO001_01350, partial [Alloprevotella sp.]|nr:hypothetical protein [Alloprevotella sp.]
LRSHEFSLIKALYLRFSAALGNMSTLYFLTFSAALACTKIALACAKICFEIFGCARQSSNKFDSALACAKIREISATDQVAILLIERD